MNAEVTIIIPNYNKDEYLNDCIESVLNQLYKDWQLIVIDDASTDKSRSILSNFKNISRLSIINLKKNKGPAFCRNLGIRLSKTKYIAFLDSDDFWNKNKLKDQLEFMKKNNISMSFTDYFIFKDKDKNNIIRTTNLKKEFDYNSFIKNTSINTSTLILKNNIIGSTKFKNLRLLEDYIFKCELLKKGIVAHKLNKSYSAYRITSKARSSNKFKNLLYLWKVNKEFNKLNFFKNLTSIISIATNSIKKCGFKKYN